MSLSILLVHVDDSPHAASRIDAAARVAANHGARLIGLSVVSRNLMRPDVARFLPQSEVNRAMKLGEENARSQLDKFEAIARGYELPGIESRIVDGGALEALTQASRYADLVVVSQGQSEVAVDTSFEFPAEVVMQSGRPALIVSRAWQGKSIGKRVAAAWDGSREAARALTDAMPILKKADQVDVLIFNSSKRPLAHGEEPGADIGLWLTRHGVKVQVRRDTVDIDIGAALLSSVADLGSDLLVMGGFGHSRLRESLFGGVTRTMLETMTVPVLMSH